MNTRQDPKWVALGAELWSVGIDGKVLLSIGKLEIKLDRFFPELFIQHETTQNAPWFYYNPTCLRNGF